MRYPTALAITLALCATDSSAQAPMQFQIASVRLNVSGTTMMKFPPPAEGRFRAVNFPLKALISFAYRVPGPEIFGAPAWTNSERFDVDARAGRPDITREQYQQMLRSLLEERFRLLTHRETRDLPVYELMPAKAGSRLRAADPNACDPAGKTGVICGAFFTGASSLDGRSMSMAAFCSALTAVLGRPVADHTGLGGIFDVHLEFDPEGVDLGNGSSGLSTDVDKSDGARPSIFSALQQQLGLKLQSHRAPTEVLVVDGLERLPTDN